MQQLVYYLEGHICCVSVHAFNTISSLLLELNVKLFALFFFYYNGTHNPYFWYA